MAAQLTAFRAIGRAMAREWRLHATRRYSQDTRNTDVSILRQCLEEASIWPRAAMLDAYIRRSRVGLR